MLIFKYIFVISDIYRSVLRKQN